MLLNLFPINQNVNGAGQCQLLKPDLKKTVLKKTVLMTQASFSQYDIYEICISSYGQRKQAASTALGREITGIVSVMQRS